MANFLLSGVAKLYYSTTLIAATGNTVATAIGNLDGDDELGNVRDLTLNISPEFVDASTRSDHPFTTEVKVRNNSEVTWEMNWKDTDPAFDAIRAVALDTDGSNAEIALFIMDNDLTDTSLKVQGLTGNFTLGFSKTENLGDIQKVSVTAKASSFPAWYVRAAV